ncbi:hypothetical protein Vafri_179 [Volvox africanus]|nr:hypothetical protein Vafri_179 [Volvox africanus]
MGSLVPGWDASIGVPRDLMPDSDIDKEPQPEGYFARLRSHRHSPGGPEGDAAASSLARVSAPQYLPRSDPKKTSVPRSSTLPHPSEHRPCGDGGRKIGTRDSGSAHPSL